MRKFPRQFKFTLGVAIQNNICEIFKLIVEVNSLTQKKTMLQEIIGKAELLQIQIRLSKDLDCFAKIDIYFFLSEQLTTVLKQLEGWKKASP